MAEVINLRARRKAEARRAREKDAEANRALHGMPKAERLAVVREKSRTERALDGHLRDGRERDED